MMHSEEIWREIPGFEGLYSISSHGNVKTLDRIVKSKQRSSGNNTRTIVGRLLNHDNIHGYARVTLCNGGLKKRYLVHRLVAMVFIANPDNKPHVNHINGIKNDNQVSNLEWCTASENELHSYRILGKSLPPMSEERKNNLSVSNKGKRLTEEHLLKLRKPKSKTENYRVKKVVLNNLQVFESVKEAARLTGCKQSSISNNLIGLSKRTKVGVWEYH